MGKGCAPRDASAVVAGTVFFITLGAQRGVLSITPCLRVVSVGAEAKVTKAACDKAAIYAWAVERVTIGSHTDDL